LRRSSSRSTAVDVLILRDDVPVSLPTAGQVRVAVRACSVNHLDV
jgi:NADPH:quinone reductase-like Zn-dependent oxidoreductase